MIYINFIVLVVGLSIIKNSFNIMFVIYLFTMNLYIFYDETIAIFFIARYTNLFYYTRWSDFVKLVVSLATAIIIVWTIRVSLQLFVMFPHKIAM